MVIRIERGQRLYSADEPNRVFEGALLDIDPSADVIHLDPIATLILDPSTSTWVRTALAKGPARSAPLARVHDEENEARYYAQNHYNSPIGDGGEWAHPTKRVWTLTTGRDVGQAVAAQHPPVTVKTFKVQTKSVGAAATGSHVER
jgi:hypothetical protein